MQDKEQWPSADADVEVTSVDEANAAAAKAKKDRIVRYVFLFVFPFVMVSMLVGGYLASMHAPAPNHMPIVIAGEASQAQILADRLEGADPDAVDVRVVSTADDARELVLDQEVSGALVLPGLLPDVTRGAIYTAGAAGASQAQTVNLILTPVALGSGFEFDTEDLAPLPANDSAGLAVMFMTTGLILAGYLPLSLLLGGAPELLSLRRFLPILAGWAALAALVIWAIAGPILGAVEGHTAAVLGVSWLAVFAVGSVQLFLTRILGPLAVLAGMLFLMVLGVPASNLSLSVHTMPGVYAFLYKFLPTPATGESLRSIVYFDGNGVGGHLLVLAIGIVVALAATATIDVIRHRRDPNRPLPPVTMPPIIGGKDSSKRVRYAGLVLFPLSMIILMVGIMLPAMYQPVPRDLPVAIVANSTEQAQAAIAGLETNMVGLFEFEASSSKADATARVQDREIAGAYVLPDGATPGATLITAGASGSSQQQLVKQVFEQVAAQQGIAFDAQDVAPLPDTDTVGTVVLYLAIGWTLAGFVVVMVMNSGAPELMRMRLLIPIYAMWSLFMSLVVWVIAGPLVGAIEGHFLSLLGVGFMSTFTVALFSTVLVRWLGMAAVPIAVGILMFLGVPASGGGLSVYLEPTVFRFLHDVLPLPAAVESARSVLYFGSSGLTGHLVLLTVWATVSLAISLVVDRLRPPSPTEPETTPVAVSV